MTRRTAKTFERGEAVEYRPTPDLPWLRGRYVAASLWRGWHLLRSMNRIVQVPSRRIRKRNVK